MQKNKFRFDPGEWKKQHVTVVRKTINQTTSLHTHSFYELEMVSDGEGITDFNGSTYRLKRGSLMFLSPVDFHSVEPQGELFGVNLSFDENIISPSLQSLFVGLRRTVFFDLSEEEYEIVDRYLSKIETELVTDDEFSARETKNSLNSLLVFLVRKLKSSQEALPCTEISPVQEAVRYIFENFREEITLSDLARVSGYTPNYFSKRFREVTGNTYVSFLHRLRVNFARMLLSSTDMRIIDIAESSGFESLSSFQRVFRNFTGTTPALYRRQSKSSDK